MNDTPEGLPAAVPEKCPRCNSPRFYLDITPGKVWCLVCEMDVTPEAVPPVPEPTPAETERIDWRSSRGRVAAVSGEVITGVAHWVSDEPLPPWKPGDWPIVNEDGTVEVLVEAPAPAEPLSGDPLVDRLARAFAEEDGTDSPGRWTYYVAYARCAVRLLVEAPTPPAPEPGPPQHEGHDGTDARPESCALCRWFDSDASDPPPAPSGPVVPQDPDATPELVEEAPAPPEPTPAARDATVALRFDEVDECWGAHIVGLASAHGSGQTVPHALREVAASMEAIAYAEVDEIVRRSALVEAPTPPAPDEPGDCEHESLSGLDGKPLDHPWKVWECHQCGARIAGNDRAFAPPAPEPPPEPDLAMRLAEDLIGPSGPGPKPHNVNAHYAAGYIVDQLLYRPPAPSGPVVPQDPDLVADLSSDDRWVVEMALRDWAEGEREAATERTKEDATGAAELRRQADVLVLVADRIAALAVPTEAPEATCGKCQGSLAADGTHESEFSPCVLGDDRHLSDPNGNICGAPTGYHDDCGPLVCTLPEGHLTDPDLADEHYVDEIGGWPDGTLPSEEPD